MGCYCILFTVAYTGTASKNLRSNQCCGLAKRFDADPNPVQDPISVFDADTDKDPNLIKQS